MWIVWYHKWFVKYMKQSSVFNQHFPFGILKIKFWFALKANGVIPTSPTPMRIKNLQAKEESSAVNQNNSNISLSTYWKYFMSAHAPVQLALFIIIFLVSQLFITVIEVWIAFW